MTLRVLAVTSMLALTACASSAGRSCTPLAYFGINLAVPQLLAPTPNATGVATSNLTVTLDERTSADERVRLTGADGWTIDSGLLVSTPIPQHPDAISVTVSGLHAHTAYTLTAVGTTLRPPPTTCDVTTNAPYALAVINGAFTTQ